MSKVLTQEKLEEMVVGVQANPNAIFYEQAVLNVPRSKEAGRRMYDKQVYIQLSQPGVADTMSYRATSADLKGYPDEYEYFLQNKQGVRAPGIEMIPNLDIAHLQELRDYGFLTIPKLAEMKEVPAHLAYAHNAAKVLNTALQETGHGNSQKESSTEEESKPPTEAEEAGFVSATGRSLHTDAVERSPIPTSGSNPTTGRDSRGNGQSGRLQRDNIVKENTKFSDNWNIEITW